MKRNFALLGIGWVLVVLFSWRWEYNNAVANEARSMLEISRVFFRQILLTREWNARHGGVYVFRDATTPSNPYLDVKLRDIVLDDNRTLTLVNPAYMTRQISEITKEYNGVRMHITSLNPIRPANAPTPWERETLNAFESGLKERGEFFEQGYRYMAPLQVQESCLKCHGKQGYRIGDIRGGISISIPYDRKSPSLGGGHFLIAVSGLLLIFLVGRQLRQAYLKLETQSKIDVLTGVTNRRYFMARLKEEHRRTLRAQQPLALIMVDIDYFKAYNDLYGHVEGDRCLKAVAHCMQQTLKRTGDCIARYGGEEFVIMLPNTPLHNAEHFAQELRSAVEALQIPHGASRCADVVTGSFGVAVASAEGGSYETLIRQADEALYKAKKRGRNRVERAGGNP